MTTENINKEDEAITYHRAEMESYSDAQLLRIINEKSPRDLQHIAAKLTLHERSKTDLDMKHKQSMSEIVKANRFSYVILIITALTFLLALTDFVSKYIVSPKRTDEKKQEIKSIVERPAQTHKGSK